MRGSVLLGLCFLLGCPSEGEEAPPDSTTWYEGTLTATKPDGDPLGDPVPSLLRRTHMPADERIEEQWIEVDESGLGFEVLSSQVVTAEDGTFTLQYQDEFGLLEGFGSLDRGDDWAWTAWQSQAEYVSGEITGSQLLSLAEVEGGVLEITTDVLGADSELEVIEVRALTEVSEATFTTRRGELLGG